VPPEKSKLAPLTEEQARWRAEAGRDIAEASQKGYIIDIPADVPGHRRGRAQAEPTIGPMDWWLFALLFVAASAARLVANAWLARRWIRDGMTPTRAALLSMAIAYVPLLGLLVIASSASGRPISLTTWALILVVMALPLVMGFGMRRAVFDYMDRHGVKDELKRHQK